MSKSDLLRPGERLDDLQYNNLYIIQDPKKYCFSSDATKLANFVSCKKGAKIVDLCSGSGIVGILALNKTGAGHCTMVEIQETMCDMSIRSIKYNNQEDKFTVVNSDLKGVNKIIGTGYDVVVCNPPYRKIGSMLKNIEPSIAIARHEINVTLEDIFIEASKLLRFGGSLYLVHKEDRLVDIIDYARKYNLEPKELIFDPSKSGLGQILVKCVLGGHSGIKIKVYHE